MARKEIIETEIVYPESENYSAEEMKELCCGEDVGELLCGKSGKEYTWEVGAEQDHWPEPTKALIHQAKYDPLLEIQWEARDQPCGMVEEKYDFEGCCDNPPDIPLQFNETPPSEVVEGTYRICAKGGFKQYSWSYDGPLGVSVSGTGDCAVVYVSDCFCGTGEIICTDSCADEIRFEITNESCLYNELIYDDENSADQIAQNSSAYIYWQGGKVPYTVSVSGEGVYVDSDKELTSILTNGTRHRIYTGESCGYLEVTVKDACGNTVSGDLYTNGVWKSYRYYSNACYFPGWGAFAEGGFTCNTNGYSNYFTQKDQLDGEKGLIWDYDSGDIPNPDREFSARYTTWGCDGSTRCRCSSWMDDPYLRTELGFSVKVINGEHSLVDHWQCDGGTRHARFSLHSQCTDVVFSC